MNYGKALAVTNIVLCIGAAIGYACVKDWRRAAYWFFAACITASVTF